MKLSINKAIKNNFYFFSLSIGISYLIYLNIQVFVEYWKEKLYWLELRTGKLEYVSEQTFISIKDYAEYGPHYWGFFVPHLNYNYGIFFYFSLIFLFVFYVFFSIIYSLIYKKINSKCFIIIDVLTFSLFGYIWIFIILRKPMFGVIPVCILLPLFFCILLCFRIRQYKKKLIF